ncbi:RnfH family protein [Buchnera aphidicola]|uniref:RnfH family protein n=1 Tax=Buchnera aphidicola TaxID=9 RepID=UPI0034640669
MKKISVTIIYARANHQFIHKVDIIMGSTVREAIIYSNVLNIFKEISLYKNKIGIYNKIVKLKHVVKNEDRIEIYRDLIIDPKERRRNRIIFLKKS